MRAAARNFQQSCCVMIAALEKKVLDRHLACRAELDEAPAALHSPGHHAGCSEQAFPLISVVGGAGVGGWIGVQAGGWSGFLHEEGGEEGGCRLLPRRGRNTGRAFRSRDG